MFTFTKNLLSLRSIYYTLLFTLVYSVTNGQQVFLDEVFEDWHNIHTTIDDPQGDTSFLGHDFRNLWVHNDDKYLYLSFEVQLDLILQDPNEISIRIDTDNNPSTGESIGNIGADFTYYPGARNGEISINGNNFFVSHIDVGYVSLPTVSSNRFECKIDRTIELGGFSLDMGNTIRVAIIDATNGGDRIPDSPDGFQYNLKDLVQELPTPSLDKVDLSHLRVLSYNVERDAFFENGTEQSISRIIKAINPDIIAFQEIYDHGPITTASQVADIFDNPDLNWYSAKVEPDIIMVSQYPIIESASIENDGNGAFLIRKGQDELLFINLHLPCCDNNAGRMEEVGNIVNFVDDLKNGLGPFTLKENTPIIILGDTNFVGQSEQVALLKAGVTPGIDWGTPLEDSKPPTTGEPMSITWYQPNSSYCPGRLDYILYSGELLDLQNNYVLFTPGLTDNQLIAHNLENNDSTNGSDHLPVVADFNISGSSSLENVAHVPNVTIFPNPAHDIVTIRFNNWKGGTVKIYNSIGQELITEQILGDNLQLNLGDLPKGYYRAIVSDGNQLISKSILLL